MCTFGGTVLNSGRIPTQDVIKQKEKCFGFFRKKEQKITCESFYQN
jgi:hypothetical protein